MNNGIGSMQDFGAHGGNVVHYSRAKALILSARRKSAARDVAEMEMGMEGWLGVGRCVVV